MKYSVLSVTIILTVSLAAAIVLPAGAGPFNIKLNSFDVALMTLEKPYQSFDAAGKSVTYAQAYLVRLHGDFPKDRALLMELYVGTEQIEEYGGLPDGIYFQVYEKSKLDELSGQEFGYRFESDGIKRLGHKFEPQRFAPFKAMKEKEAFSRR